MKVNSIQFSPEIITKYDKSGPRYTSYPTAVQFRPEFSMQDFYDSVQDSNEDLVPHALSVYVHIPFCANVCFYCACNKIITRDVRRAEEYVEYLKREIKLKGALFDNDRKVQQLHFGGGTPTFLSPTSIAEIVDRLGEEFSLSTRESRDFSIEIDPRTIDEHGLDQLKDIGFNRVSFGVQDLDPEVQKAVNREQDEQEIRRLISHSRDIGFRSINIDLMYGLPFQNENRFLDTIDKVIDISPDRISMFNYAHLPERFKPQTRIKAETLPSAAEKLAIHGAAIKKLDEAGYVFIGMDHFAKPQDELARAQEEKRLHRNFQGYTTHSDCDLVAFGVTSIGFMDDCYVQNYHDVEDYYRAIDESRLPIARGVNLSMDDKLRRQIIMDLMCHFSVDIGDVEDKYAIDFAAYFADELSKMDELQGDGLVEIEDNRVSITPRGRMIARVVCMIFDRYLGGRKEFSGFSKVI